MRSLLFISLLLLSMMQSLASTTVLQGSVKGFDGESLRLASYQDYISFKKTYLGEVIIEDGQFKIEFELEQTHQIMIYIQDKQTSLFAEPGQVYNISLSYSDESNSQRAFEKYLDLQFAFPKANELNQKVKAFNQDYQEFFSKHYRKFVINEANEELEKFIEEQEGQEKYRSPEFLNVYVDYALANLKDINNGSKKELFEDYLKNRKVKVKHKEYMNFFKQYYAEDFEQLLITKRGNDLMKSIMLEQSLNKSIYHIKLLKGMESDELAELYLMNGLYEVYYKKTVDQKSNLFLLDQLSKEGSTKELKNTAQNIHEKLRLGGTNSKAPNFSLVNTDGNTVQLEDLKGKPIYLGFWANWSLLSLRELKLIQKLEQEYGEEIHFVSINIDEKSNYFRSVKEDNNYTWTFLFGGKEYELRDLYDVKTAPVYFLIDENGDFIKRFAPGPDNIRSQLKSISSLSN